MLKRKLTYKTATVAALIIWGVFLWLHTFTRLTCYEDYSGKYSYLVKAIAIMAFTFIEWFSLKPENGISILSLLFDFDEDLLADDMEELTDDRSDNSRKSEKKSSRLKKSLLGTSIVALIYLIAFAVEKWTGASFFEDAISLDLGFIVLNKKYLFDPFLLIIVPLWLQVIFRGMSDEDFSWNSIISGSVQITMLTLFGYLLFMKLPNVWLIEFSIIESFLLVGAISKYVWKSVEKKGNVLALFVSFEGLWFLLLSLFHYTGQSFTEYTYGRDWNMYKENIWRLMSNASVFGNASVLRESPDVIEFLTGRNNYLHNSLYYGGWMATGFILLLLMVFLVITRKMLGTNKQQNRNYLVYSAAWWSLAFRVIIGTLYSFGIIALPVSLPFAGTIGISMDTVALGLLVWSAIEAKSIDNSFYIAGNLVDRFDGVGIELPEERNEIWYNYDFCELKTDDGTVKCFIEYFDEYHVAVLDIEKEPNCIYILKKDKESGKWIDVDDQEIRNIILNEYTERNQAKCMEFVK